VLVSVGACLLKDPLHVLCIVGVDLDGGAFVVLAKRVLVTPLHLLGVRDAVLRLAWGRGDGALLIDDLRWEHVECTVEAHGDVWQEDSASALETYPPNAPVSQSLSLSLSVDHSVTLYALVCTFGSSINQWNDGGKVHLAFGIELDQ
jgi:hypothetical protein